MSSGVARMVTGAVLGTAALLNVRTVGFRPRRVELENSGGLASGVWQDSMADDSVLKRVTAGTQTFPLSGGVIPLSDGFSLGTDSDLNVAGELIHYTAFE